MPVNAHVPNLQGTKRLSDLDDVNEYSKNAGKILKINAKGDGTEWASLDAFQNFDEVKLELEGVQKLSEEIKEQFLEVKAELGQQVDSSYAIAQLRKEDETLHDKIKSLTITMNEELSGSAEAVRDLSKYVDQVKDNTDKAMKLAGDHDPAIASLRNSGALLQSEFDKLVERVAGDLSASKLYTDQEVAKAVDLIKKELSGMVMSDSEIMTKIVKLMESDKSMEERVTSIETDYVKRDVTNKQSIVELKTIDLQHDTKIKGIEDVIATMPTKTDVSNKIKLETESITADIQAAKLDVSSHTVRLTSIEALNERQQQTIGDQAALIAFQRDQLTTVDSVVKAQGVTLASEVKVNSTQDEKIAALEAAIKKVGSSSGSVIGDIKTGIQTTDHSGWYLMDGRALTAVAADVQNTLKTLGFAAMPDMRGKVLMATGANGVSAIKAFGGSAQIQRNHLPNVNLSGSTYNAGNHSHGIYGNGGWDGYNSVGGSDRGGGGYYWNTNGGGDHAHSFIVSLNGGVAQVNYLPPHMGVNSFIYLG